MYLHPEGKNLCRATVAEFVDFLVAYLDLLRVRLEAPGEVVSLSSLRGRGIQDHILLWMLYQGHVEHVQQAANGQDTNGQDGSHGWTPADSLILGSSSGFVLTDLGQEFVGTFLCEALYPDSAEAFAETWEKLLVGELTPRFNKDERIFTWGRHLLKHFRQPAINQELILRVAEELNWARWFDDPLLRRPGKSRKVQLHDTIKDLNRRQLRPFIHFKGDGSGRRVGWEYQ